MTDFAFYELTKTTLEKMANLRDLPHSELEKYYSHTDQYVHFYSDLSEVPQVFAQMIFHMQNATRISNIVKFNDNYNFLKTITCNFVPNCFIRRYAKHTDRVAALVDDLRWNESLGTGLKWDSTKSQKEDFIAKRLAKSMFECAEYLSKFDTKNDVFIDLQSHSTSPEELIGYFNSKIRTGFSVALTCDFLKEFDTYFEFLPKPDVHIRDVVSALKHKTYKNDIDLLKDVQQITRNINSELAIRGEQEITVYQLDRMIWLVCTGNFFIPAHDKGNIKQFYISKII